MGRKSGFAAFVLWCGGFFLLFGLHRFYIGRFWTGMLWLFTFGLCGVGQLIDLFRLGDMVRVANSAGAGSVRHLSSANTVAPVFNVTVNTVPAGVMPTTSKQIGASTPQLLSQR